MVIYIKYEASESEINRRNEFVTGEQTKVKLKCGKKLIFKLSISKCNSSCLYSTCCTNTVVKGDEYVFTDRRSFADYKRGDCFKYKGLQNIKNYKRKILRF
jgi:hypothetical protein